jgi:hypothetical protein
LKNNHYNHTFFAQRYKKAENAANLILKIVKDKIVDFKSVVDVGTGTGTWLNVSADLGAKKIKGYDGYLTDNKLLEIPTDCFEVHDLEKSIYSDEFYDLALCLEVGEHIDKKFSSSLVSTLCNLSDNVLFSAAIPGQLGVGHINEQWPEYWIKLFHEKGFNCIDIIRPKIWTDSSIPFWYRQNSLVFSKGHVSNENLPSFNGSNLVHPELYATKIEFEDKRSRFLDKIKNLFFK